MQDKMVLQKELNQLNAKHLSLSNQANNMKVAFANLKKQHEIIDKKLAVKSEELDFRTKLLHEIYVKKVSYPMKAKVMTNLFNEIVKHKSKVVSVDNNESDMIIKIRSDNDKHITELLTKIASMGRYSISTKTIKKDLNTTYYESSIKVGLNVR
ncbi:MAG: hypothetical protein DSZ06_00820 [Sulfurospirillum sp.]|nr:MAG: hypothetical protein DSZ06_00820 [Sulfurospirillum sp.]